MPMTFRELYEEHLPFVWRSLRRLGVRETDLGDAAQEVFVVVHRRLAEFEGRSKITTWLFGICLRVASSRRRVSGVREVSTGEALDVVDEHADVEAAVERLRGIALLEAILHRMSLEQRTVFILFELDGVPLAEIADLVSAPLGTVQSRLRLARQAFRAAVDRAQASGDSRLRFAEEAT
jgi:RNA polymerase sigma-70 factor, ECF subfamily